jgi:hypothetical protein
MSNFEEVQSTATEQALREQNQLLKKQLEDMNAQMQAFMTQQQGNMTAQSSQNSQEAQAQNQEHVVKPPAPTAAQVNILQEPTHPPQVAVPQAYAPQAATTGQSTSKTEQLEYILSKLTILEGNQGMINPTEFCIVTDLEIPKDFKIPDFSKYDGSGDPKIHVFMYTSMMGAYLRYDKLMMHYFQDSLNV